MSTEWKVIYYSRQDGSIPKFIVLTNAFDKHSAQVPQGHINQAIENRTDFLSRFSEKDIEEKLL